MARVFRKLRRVTGSPDVHRVFLTLLVLVGGSSFLGNGCA